MMTCYQARRYIAIIVSQILQEEAARVSGRSDEDVRLTQRREQRLTVPIHPHSQTLRNIHSQRLPLAELDPFVLYPPEILQLSLAEVGLGLDDGSSKRA